VQKFADVSEVFDSAIINAIVGKMSSDYTAPQLEDSHLHN
jgi:hypothetical protein